MTSTRPKQDPAKGGRKASQFPDSASVATANVASDTLDASLLQSMMESLKNDIFGKIDASAANLHSEILSVRQELKSSVEPCSRGTRSDDVRSGASCY
ncbi:Histone H2B.2 sperm [Dissostichus eleginoides]|uniref:Histone H2B.2 sperm n=1 Tax=Dissostichus eleginoides TaxID=100907 RepID=A0AAD9F9G7_DISEL|nr:Histone H2B.2 sperm [Dissostichus eleginoides]